MRLQGEVAGGAHIFRLMQGIIEYALAIEIGEGYAIYDGFDCHALNLNFEIIPFWKIFMTPTSRGGDIVAGDIPIGQTREVPLLAALGHVENAACAPIVEGVNIDLRAIEKSALIGFVPKAAEVHPAIALIARGRGEL